MLYSVKKTELFPLKHKKVLEKDVQKLVGENLEKLINKKIVLALVSAGNKMCIINLFR